MYIALEYLDGRTLSDYCRGVSHVLVDSGLRILAQVCCGLEAAHYRGIVHRDLKPGNIMLVSTELNPLFVKVLDFGIAKLSDPGLAGGVATRTNAIAGTPSYMAPEQARGLRDADHRADIYALGVIVYRMMTRRLPFQGDSLGEIVYQQTMTVPPAPIELRPDLPLGWDSAIRRALLSAPHNRQGSAREFALELANATPDGLEIVREVAPLFFSKTWVARTKRLAINPAHAATAAAAAAPSPRQPAAQPVTVPEPPPRPALPAASAPPGAHATPGGTISYPDPTPSAAEVPTTLSSAVRPILAESPNGHSRRRGLLAAVLAVSLLVIGTAVGFAVRSNRSSSAQQPPADAAVLETLDAGVTAVSEVSVDASISIDASAVTAKGSRIPARKTSSKNTTSSVKKEVEAKKEATEPTKAPTKTRVKKPPKRFDPNAPLGGT